MRQPVFDTLQLCDALCRTGMERAQAEALARTLGKELGAHVAVQSDLQSGFQEVRNDLGLRIEQVRCDLDLKIEQVRSDLTTRIQAVDGKVDACNQKLTFVVTGFGILLSVLTVISGMGLLQRTPPPPVLSVVQPAALPAAAPSAKPDAD